MITRIEIPKLTLTMESARLVKWLKQEGEAVEKDESLLELETDKAVVDMPSPVGGFLRKILVDSGSVSVGEAVALVGDPSDEVPAAFEENTKSEPAPHFEPASVRSQSTPDLVRATPAAKRRARELGIDLHNVSGTGPEGRITQEDVEQVASSSVNRSSSEDHRGTIAERTSKAWRTIPHIHIGGHLIARGLTVALEKGRSTVGPALSITDLLAYTTASLLGEFRSLNATWRDEQTYQEPQIHLAFAVQTDFGVVTPVIHDADQLSLADLAAKRKDLTARALARRLELNELSGGTFTITNLGMYPVDFFAPIINYPQVAIIATGRVSQVAEVRGAQIVPEWKMWANLAVDHRVADGATAARFLQRLEESMATLPTRI